MKHHLLPCHSATKEQINLNQEVTRLRPCPRGWGVGGGDGLSSYSLQGTGENKN